MNTGTLLPCPFCGGPAEMIEDGLSNGMDVWAFIRCKHHCDATPHVGSSRAIKRDWLTEPTLTVKEAQHEATEDATKKWNKRA